ncbi:hypothetical protein AAFF_G00340910 [Aldrovandia affinis]|uniref:Uncharacterized protein n=1 Tax=Aldrovandia affinis TaxID=143900 RepID=A0AAD7SKR6_9TELE|nr:hypothetical protein AAFF_G00340910 [Aldrovandia affinis]
MTLQSSVWLCALLCLSRGGNFPSQCIEENVTVNFPRSAFVSNGTSEQGDGVETVLYQALHGIAALFENDLPTEWDEMKLRDFENIVGTQLEISKCGAGRKPGSEGSDLDASARTATLRTYFERLATVLQEKNFSFCAWEIVRNQLLQTLLFILEHNSDSLLW